MDATCGLSDVDGEAAAPQNLLPASARPHHIPVLDGVRAVSILLVVISHGGLGRVVPGSLGVSIFFVVSGFLITQQLIAEAARTGKIGLRNFYARRVLRLAPALLVFIALAVPILAKLGLNVSVRDVLSAMFYFANYNDIYSSDSGRNPVSILWSLSVEEHYYLVFPVVIVLFARHVRRLILPICLNYSFGVDLDGVSSKSLFSSCLLFIPFVRNSLAGRSIGEPKGSLGDRYRIR